MNEMRRKERCHKELRLVSYITKIEMKRCFAFIAIMLFAHVAISQRNFVYTRFKKQEGLVSTETLCIYQDSKGIGEGEAAERYSRKLDFF